jgi:threonine dehydrogenase-like Zn-dependent dehydrogenase
LAKAFGARVFATAGSDEKCEAARARLGAEHAFNYRTVDWVAEGKRVTDGRGVNVDPRYRRRRLHRPQPRSPVGSKGGCCRSPSSRGGRAEADFSVMMRKRLWITGFDAAAAVAGRRRARSRATAGTSLAAAREGRGGARDPTRRFRSRMPLMRIE